MTLTPEAQRIAIAEACGWTDVETYLGTYIIGRKPGDFNIEGTKHIPDYLNDFNAMHEAEKVMGTDAWLRYQGELARIGLAFAGKCWIHATAAQRAEAFLRTLGLWKVDACPQSEISNTANT